jgi:hypothetical protein
VHLNKAGCRLWLDYLRTHAVGDYSEYIASPDEEVQTTENVQKEAAE